MFNLITRTILATLLLGSSAGAVAQEATTDKAPIVIIETSSDGAVEKNPIVIIDKTPIFIFERIREAFINPIVIIETG